jgi:uncharacterized protein YraI
LNLKWVLMLRKRGILKSKVHDSSSRKEGAALYVRQCIPVVALVMLQGAIGFESTANAIAQETITLDADLVSTLDAELDSVQGSSTKQDSTKAGTKEKSTKEPNSLKEEPAKSIDSKAKEQIKAEEPKKDAEVDLMRASSSIAIASVAQVPPPKQDIAEAKVAARLKSTVDISSPAATITGGTSTAISQRDKRIAELTRKLQQARNDLMVAEMEVERLSNIIEDRNQASLGKAGVRYSGQSASASRTQPSLPQSGVSPRMATKRSYASGGDDESFADESPQEMRPPVAEASSDMQIATVIANKANLRTGPSKDNSPLMSVAKGTRLAIEHRVGEWYRVIAPTGMRAWISGEVLAFGRDDRSAPSRTLRVQGVNLGVDSSDNDGEVTSSEDEANPSPSDSEGGSDEDAYRLIMGESSRK